MSPAPGVGRRTDLLGRAKECALLDELISTVHGGASRSLLIHGEAGIGKTALLKYLVASASGLTVAQAAGLASETELAYASLHQLCAPFLDDIGRLPAPQRGALQVVFGISPGSPPDPFMIGLAVLSLLSVAADQGPLLCVVDDAQWLDQASSQTLSFVARRLTTEPIGLVFAVRDPGDFPGRVPALRISGISDDDARLLLGQAIQFVLDERVRDRIIAETHGNPLALHELPRGLSATQVAGGFGLLDIELAGLTGQIEERLLQRLEALTEPTRRFLLLAAAEPVGDPRLLWRAAKRLGIGLQAAREAETQGFLEIGKRVTFRHPGQRSAVYRTATARQRRAMHSVLATETDREADPDRRAWHLAAAAAGSDEEVAVELERAARHAQKRGGVAARAAFLRRAVTLSGDPARRAERLLTAAEATFQVGDFDTALGLLANAEAGEFSEFQKARGDLLRGHIAFAAGRADDAPPLLLTAARRLEPLDLDLARESYLIAWGAAMTTGQRSGDARLEISRAVQALPPPQDPQRPIDLLLAGLALLTTDGHGAATATLQKAANVLTGIPLDDVLRWGWMAGYSASLIWDFECLHLMAVRQAQLVRAAGALAQLPLFLSQLGMALAKMGDLPGTASLIPEIDNAAAAIGSPIAPYTLLRLRALQGRKDEVAAVMTRAVEHARGTGQGLAVSWTHWAEAVLNNGLAHYRQAASAARYAAADTLNPWMAMWALPELVEAAERSQQLDLAQDALERLVNTTRPCGTDLALGIEARCHALLSDGTEADGLYRKAIEHLNRTSMRPDLARTHLLYGEWLRRQNHRSMARKQLQTAHDMFGGIGMEAFAERARGELLATAETARPRTVEAYDELTAQERQIAFLARDGLSNAEIGERLSVSPRTVEWHLRNVFGKLGIKSRRQLAGALADPGAQTPGV